MIVLPSEQLAQVRQRQNRLKEAIDADGVAILWSAQRCARNRDNDFPFRQDSNFSYLTGFPEPQAVAVFAPGRAEGEYLLFCRPRDPQKERWEGEIIGPQRARDCYGADQAFDIAELEERLLAILNNRRCIYADLDADSENVGIIRRSISTLQTRCRLGVEVPQTIHLLSSVVGELRLIKDDDELQCMTKAAEIAVAAHKAAMLAAQQARYEYQVQARLEQVMRYEGACPAFNSIVASGGNACVLHYTNNGARLPDHGYMLIDAGAEYQGYASDITTTFPIGRPFNGEQRAVYELVQQAHSTALSALGVGVSWHDVHRSACAVLTQGLVDLGVLEGSCDDLMEKQAWLPWFMHRIGHWLGRDVHDAGSYFSAGKWRDFVPGMALTIEPGLYFSPSEQVDERWWGIGVRIEDSVVINEEGYCNLTAGLPRRVDDINHFLGLDA